jgi:hypothetical protein
MVEIPYEETTLPGYFLRPVRGDDRDAGGLG